MINIAFLKGSYILYFHFKMQKMQHVFSIKYLNTSVIVNSSNSKKI